MNPLGYNPMLPYFAGRRAVAANVPQPGEVGDYTAEMFQTDFPQFFTITPAEEPDGEATVTSLVPENMLDMFIENANVSVLPSRWGTMWEYAAGLYVAHFCAMYLKTYSPSSDSAEQVASGADQIGVVKSATIGDTSISYDNSAITAATQEWGSWNATIYGSQLVTLAKQIGALGMYVI